MKKFLGICAALGLLAAADDAECMQSNGVEGDFNLEQENTVLTVRDGVTDVSLSINDPKAHEARTTVQTVVLPNSAEQISNYCFMNWKALTTVVIPASVTELGAGVFWNCTNLREFIAPCHLESVGWECFGHCTALEVVRFGAVKKIGEGAFYHCENLLELELGNELTELGDRACSNCKMLPTINLGDNLESIGEACFVNCYKLQTVTFGRAVDPNGSLNVAVDAFAEAGVTKLDFSGYHNVSLEFHSLCGCGHLTSIIFNNDTKVHRQAYWTREKNSLKVVILINSAKTGCIEWGAFQSYCTSLLAISGALGDGEWEANELPDSARQSLSKYITVNEWAFIKSFKVQ